MNYQPIDQLIDANARFSLMGVDFKWSRVGERVLLNRVEDGVGMGYVKLPGPGSQVFTTYIRQRGGVFPAGELPWDSLQAAQFHVLAYVANDSED